MSIFDNVTFMNEENYHNRKEYEEYKRKEQDDEHKKRLEDLDKRFDSNKRRSKSTDFDSDLYDKSSKKAMAIKDDQNDDLERKANDFINNHRDNDKSLGVAKALMRTKSIGVNDLTKKIYQREMKKKKQNKQVHHNSAGIFESVEII